MTKKVILLYCISILMAFQLLTPSNLFHQPKHFPEPKYNFSKNPLDSLKVELGRILFYDPILSVNNSVSCASCHSPYNAFAHTDHDLSHGVFDSIGTRNAPALFNLAWQESFMWDGSINHLDMQALAPISHPNEMGSNISDVIKKLNDSESYKKLFSSAYKDSIITSSKLLKALSQFQLTLVSADSKYDKVMMGKEKFTTKENTGYQLFKQNCNSCHTEPLFSSYQFENNGLVVDPTLNDYGRYQVSLIKSDSLKFKVPSLRNLSFSYPYMHDGRFRTLKEVLNHYTDEFSISNSNATLAKNIKLSSNEKADLIAFLISLNDKAFVFDEKHQFKKIPDPFPK